MKKYFILNLILCLFKGWGSSADINNGMDIEYNYFLEKNSHQEYSFDLDKIERQEIHKLLFRSHDKAENHFLDPHKVLFSFGIARDNHHLYFTETFIDAVINLCFVEQEIYKTIQINELKEAQTAAKVRFAQKLQVALKRANGVPLEIAGFAIRSSEGINGILDRLFNNPNFREGQLKFSNNNIYFYYSLTERYSKIELNCMHRASSNFNRIA